MKKSVPRVSERIDLRQPVDVYTAMTQIKERLIKDSKGHEIVMVQDPRKGKGKKVPRCAYCGRSPKQRGICSKIDMAVAVWLAEAFAVKMEDVRMEMATRTVYLTMEEFENFRDGMIGSRPRGTFGQILEDFHILKKRHCLQPGGTFRLYTRNGRPGKDKPVLEINVNPSFAFAPVLPNEEENIS